MTTVEGPVIGEEEEAVGLMVHTLTSPGQGTGTGLRCLLCSMVEEGPPCFHTPL